jgi:hypothetical protein
VVKLAGRSHLSARGREGRREGGPAGVCWAGKDGWTGSGKTGRGGKEREEKVGRGWKGARKEEDLIFFLFLFFNPFKTKLSNLLLMKPFQVSKIIFKNF